MSIPDMAEYWQDVKSNYPYMGPQFYHIPDAKCGHRHLNLAGAIGDVNCHSCLLLIENGLIHNLPEGETDFRSKSQKRREKKYEKARIEYKKYGKCSHCNGFLKQRFNSIKKTFFLGCENYPKCKYTKQL